jgi:hypothetical protein
MARTPTTPAAPSAASHEDEVLIREIDEAVREDAMLTFLRDHGMKVLGVVLAGVAALGGYLVWDHYAESALEQKSEGLISALDYVDQRDFQTAADKVAPLVADGSPAARASARFMQAGAALESGDTAKASTLYKAIVADAEAPGALRDLARIRDVTLNFDEMKPADVISQLTPLAQKGNPFFGSAGELVAMAHIEAGNRQAAGKIFSEIASQEDLPKTLRSRARQMAGLMGVDAVVDVDQLLKDQGVVKSDDSTGAGAPAQGGGSEPAAAQ